MLWEPDFWKKDLLKVALKLEKRMQSTRWTRRQAATIQQEILWAGFAIRRLNEADALPSGLMDSEVQILSYPSIPNDDKEYNYDDFHSSYDLMHPRSYFQRYDLVIQSIIHSYYFSLVYQDSYLYAFNYCSERRMRFLSMLKLADFLTMIRNAAVLGSGPEYKAFRLTIK